MDESLDKEPYDRLVHYGKMGMRWGRRSGTSSKHANKLSDSVGKIKTFALSPEGKRAGKIAVFSVLGVVGTLTIGALGTNVILSGFSAVSSLSSNSLTTK